MGAQSGIEKKCLIRLNAEIPAITIPTTVKMEPNARRMLRRTGVDACSNFSTSPVRKTAIACSRCRHPLIWVVLQGVTAANGQPPTSASCSGRVNGQHRELHGNMSEMGHFRQILVP